MLSANYSGQFDSTCAEEARSGHLECQGIPTGVLIVSIRVKRNFTEGLQPRFTEFPLRL